MLTCFHLSWACFHFTLSWYYKSKSRKVLLILEFFKRFDSFRAVPIDHQSVVTAFCESCVSHPLQPLYLAAFGWMRFTLLHTMGAQWRRRCATVQEEGCRFLSQTSTAIFLGEVRNTSEWRFQSTFIQRLIEVCKNPTIQIRSKNWLWIESEYFRIRISLL